VLYLSTGVIGSRLPVEKILDKLPQLCSSASVNGLGDFAQAIMTTDLVPKVRTLAVEDRSGPPFRVTGIAKGSGMIHPNMATMFGFVISDAPSPGSASSHSTVEPPASTGSRSTAGAQASAGAHASAGSNAATGLNASVGSQAAMLSALRSLAAKSFNRVTVDGDTSPNDTMILWCSGAASRAALNGKAAPSPVAWSGAQQALFDDAVLEVSCELCRAIAADGEGATRLVTVDVRGAPSEEAAAHVARTIATSPLTKSAVHGRDPNWGRILAAAGRAGVEFDVDRARVWIGEADVYSNGKPHPENEPAAHLHLLQNHEVVLGVDLGAGSASAQAWTCDFSADYVRINADYRS